MYDFFQKYFLIPTYNLSGYNIVNTLSYAIIFIVSFYFLHYILNKLKIHIDKQFVISFLPFAMFGIFYRLRVDYGRAIPNLLSVTPGAWIIPFLLWFFSFILFNYATKDEYKSKKYTGFIGLLVLIALIIISPPTLSNIYYFMMYTILTTIVFYLFWKYDNFYLLAFFGEFVDATGSYFGIKNGFFEEHVLPRFIINNLGLIYYPIIKLLVTVLVLYIIYKAELDENTEKLVLLTIFVLGFGPGSRNWFLLMYYL